MGKGVVGDKAQGKKRGHFEGIDEPPKAGARMRIRDGKIKDIEDG
jgi:hypothetical protein